MYRHLTDYLIALAVCLCAAIGYRFIAVPLIEPTTGPVVEIHNGMQELKGPDLGHVFAADSWQMNNPKVLQAEWGWLLFQRWQQDAPDRWRVAPVSIVMKARNKEGDDDRSSNTSPGGPIVLSAPEGAVIEFAEPLNMISGATPAIKGGQLLGEVHIYNQEIKPESHYQVEPLPANDSFDLVTRNVRIDNRQIRSAEEVNLKVGGAKIIGRDLTIKLAAGGTLPTSMDGPLSVLDSLELIYLDDLTVPLPEGPLWEPQSKTGSGGETGPTPPVFKSVAASYPQKISPYLDAKLTVACDGRVVFDFATFTLRMNQRVELQHHWDSQHYDSFACRSLEIQLVNQFNKIANYQSKSDSVNHAGEAQDPLARVGQYLRKISASGAPIQADVPSLNCRLTTAQIDFNAASRKLSMLGGNDTIDLEYNGIHLAIPNLDYELDATELTKLGKLAINGPGRVTVSSTDIPLRTFAWQDSLQVIPQEIGHLLWIVGKVEGRMRDGGFVVADDLLADFNLADTETNETDAEPALRLNKLRARGNVNVDTSQLAAQTDVLLVMFDHIAASEQPSPSETSPATGTRLNPATGPRQRFWINDPNGGGGSADHSREQVSNSVAPVAKPRPSLSGGAITANLVMANNEVIAQDLSVLKNVKLQHELQTKTESLPLVYTGDSLRLITGSGDDRVQIAGTPARIDLGSGFFEGPLVIISGLENRVSIRDYGTFQIPLAIMPGGQAQSTRWISPPTCNFRGELTFDGQTVEIGDEVRLTGRVAVGQAQEIWNIDATAPKLEMTLDRAVQVTQPTDAKAAAVKRASLVGEQSEVLLMATKFSPQGQPLGHHILSNPRLDFYAATGQLLGQGPGWYRSWTPTQEDSPMRSISPPGSLLAVHLIYNGRLDGNLADRQLGFERGVRVGMSSVPDWNTNIDAATMSQLALNQGTVDCDRLQLGVTTTRTNADAKNLPWEIQALGGVAFRMLSERGLVDGTAARAAFDAGNDLFVLEGSPTADAVVRNTSLTGQPLMHVNMLSFTLRPETLEINTLVRGATVSQIPGQSPSSRP